jgi:UDP-GlcNAc3NAcA epimerase
MKILTVVGARPQFIKAAVVSRAFKESKPEIKEILVHTGQHYDSNMSDVFFDELDIPQPTYNLCIGGGTHGQNTGRMLEKIEELMAFEKPNWVIVYGDTDSTLAAALAASKLHIPVAHIEAGLRSFNRRMPEEINRVLTDHISTMLFAPTDSAKMNLIHEGIAKDKIYVVGDVMYDASLFYKDSLCIPKWFKKMGLTINKFVLCTIHRAENTDNFFRMKAILDGLSSSFLPVVLPIHPRTRKRITEMGFLKLKNIYLVDPVSYLEMVWLESNCKLIATDSGGVQKEAYFHRKYCLTLRDETEWVELVEEGINKLVGANTDIIKKFINHNQTEFNINQLYGDGCAGLKIVNYF